jgi:nitrite reductase/ring-hydroxylating ferredoxin subunit
MALSETATISKESIPSDGEMKQVAVAGFKLAVANVAGTMYAFGDTSTHRQCPLSKGELEGTTVTCPCHGSQFDITTGAVLRGPAEEPVGSYEVMLEGEGLKVQV